MSEEEMEKYLKNLKISFLESDIIKERMKFRQFGFIKIMRPDWMIMEIKMYFKYSFLKRVRYAAQIRIVLILRFFRDLKIKVRYWRKYGEWLPKSQRNVNNNYGGK